MPGKTIDVTGNYCLVVPQNNINRTKSSVSTWFFAKQRHHNIQQFFGSKTGIWDFHRSGFSNFFKLSILFLTSSDFSKPILVSTQSTSLSCSEYIQSKSKIVFFLRYSSAFNNAYQLP